MTPTSPVNIGSSGRPSEGRPPLRFRSKVDAWLVALVVVSAVVAATSSLALISLGATGAPLIGAVVTLLALVLPIWLLAATHYSFEGDELRIQGGPFRWTVPIDQIHSVKPSRSLLSSPALSLDRLHVDYGNGRSILISPADKEGFLAELGSRRSATSPKS